MSEEASNHFLIIIKWSGNEYNIDDSAVNQTDTIADLKVCVC